MLYDHLTIEELLACLYFYDANLSTDLFSDVQVQYLEHIMGYGMYKPQRGEMHEEHMGTYVHWKVKDHLYQLSQRLTGTEKLYMMTIAEIRTYLKDSVSKYLEMMNAV